MFALSTLLAERPVPIAIAVGIGLALLVSLVSTIRRTRCPHCGEWWTLIEDRRTDLPDQSEETRLTCRVCTENIWQFESHGERDLREVDTQQSA